MYLDLTVTVPIVPISVALLGLAIMTSNSESHMVMVFSSHTRIFQVPSEMIEDVMQDRIDEVRRR